jgi:hypothetical protein
MAPAVFLLLLAQASASAPAAAEDRIQVLRTLVVGPGETAGDVICFGCDVVVRGRARGDAIALLGSVLVEGESGREADSVIAVGGVVRIGPQANVPASIVSVGGPVRIEPGAKASYDVDSLPWLHIPGQRQVFAEGALSLLAFVLVLPVAGALLVRTPGVAARDAALVRAPLARGLLGAALLAAVVGVMSVGERLGRLEDVAQSVLALALLGALVVGSTGVASLLGRGVVRLRRRELAPGWRSVALGALGLGLLCLVPLAGAAVAVAAAILSAGVAVVRRATLSSPPSDEVRR